MHPRHPYSPPHEPHLTGRCASSHQVLGCSWLSQTQASTDTGRQQREWEKRLMPGSRHRSAQSSALAATEGPDPSFYRAPRPPLIGCQAHAPNPLPSLQTLPGQSLGWEAFGSIPTLAGSLCALAPRKGELALSPTSPPPTKGRTCVLFAPKRTQWN